MRPTYSFGTARTDVAVPDFESTKARSLTTAQANYCRPNLTSIYRETCNVEVCVSRVQATKISALCLVNTVAYRLEIGKRWTIAVLNVRDPISS